MLYLTTISQRPTGIHFILYVICFCASRLFRAVLKWYYFNGLISCVRVDSQWEISALGGAAITWSPPFIKYLHAHSQDCTLFRIAPLITFPGLLCNASHINTRSCLLVFYMTSRAPPFILDTFFLSLCHRGSHMQFFPAICFVFMFLAICVLFMFLCSKHFSYWICVVFYGFWLKTWRLCPNNDLCS